LEKSVVDVVGLRRPSLARQSLRMASMRVRTASSERPRLELWGSHVNAGQFIDDLIAHDLFGLFRGFHFIGHDLSLFRLIVSANPAVWSIGRSEDSPGLCRRDGRKADPLTTGIRTR
jgi:hypothetical protein